jgi:hypothetical protein
MSIQVHKVSSDSGRTAIDRHAVVTAGHLLMSAIWLEHQARRFSTRLNVSVRPRPFAVSVMRLSDSHQSDRGLHAPTGWGG